MSARITVGGN